jgi:hypothetical protein
VLFAVLGAEERGYHYLVPQDLVSGQDPGDATDNRAVRDFLRFSQPEQAIESSDAILARWRQPCRTVVVTTDKRDWTALPTPRGRGHRSPAGNVGGYLLVHRWAFRTCNVIARW